MLLIFVSVILGLFLIEGCLHVYQFLGENSFFGVKPYRTTLEWAENPNIGKVFFKPYQTGWFVTPSKEYINFIKINSQGLNDSEHQLKKTKNTFRILFLGDSFVASVQTERDKTFFKQIEKRLNQKGDKKRYEVIAIGLGDTGTAQQYLALKEIGIKYKPDLVIHMFLTANDLKNNSSALMQDLYRPYFTQDDNGKLKLNSHQKYSDRKNSVLRDNIKKIYFVELILSIRQKIKEQQKNLNSDYPLDYHVYDKTYSKEYSDSWKITQKLILESKGIAEKNKGKYILVVLANNEQVNKNVWNELGKTYPNMKKNNLDLEKPDKLIRNFCNKNNLDCLELLPDFRGFSYKNPNVKTYYTIDGHWNQKGTDIAAEAIYSYLKMFLRTKKKPISQ